MRLCAESVIDVRFVLLTLSALLLTLCLVGCISSPPVNGEDTTAQASTQAQTESTQSSTNAVTDVVTEPATDSTQQPDESDTVTETTEEQTTYGELHFPEE